jgi:hypothetical protein
VQQAQKRNLAEREDPYLAGPASPTGPVYRSLADHQADFERHQHADQRTLLDPLLQGGDTLAAASVRLVRGVGPHLARPTAAPERRPRVQMPRENTSHPD